ncbi:hydantoinase B/oxoprolinase family protein [Streptomyces sp. BV286]|uniref:hydantoinase B/oxoprolinase family protein n=1 Tax=unclassified Streptomyces TaxID=2593676 RepID=UPI0020C731AE|nr:hydantoinase B/oxoprolinase family protein [Streptomyces sp. BV286]
MRVPAEGSGTTNNVTFGNERATSTTTVSTLPQHRRVPPCGMGGGEPGALGANRVEHADGTVTELAGSGTASVVPGDVLVIETPGGGGYGPPPHDTAEAHETAVACDVSEARGTTEARDTTEAGEETDDLRAH